MTEKAGPYPTLMHFMTTVEMLTLLPQSLEFEFPPSIFDVLLDCTMSTREADGKWSIDTDGVMTLFAPFGAVKIRRGNGNRKTLEANAAAVGDVG